MTLRSCGSGSILNPASNSWKTNTSSKEVCKTSAELPPEQAVGRIRAALQRCLEMSSFRPGVCTF